MKMICFNELFQNATELFSKLNIYMTIFRLFPILKLKELIDDSNFRLKCFLVIYNKTATNILTKYNVVL